MDTRYKQAHKSKAEIATIDCELITIETDKGEFGFDTANKIEVSPQIEEQAAVKLVIKGSLRAQKPKVSTITGHELKLSDNVFNPELVMILQGGKIITDDEGNILGYRPPVAGSTDKGEVFTLNAYTAQYDASGCIVQYEKTSYPNCQGQPVAFGSEDGAFRAPEYTITSAPGQGEEPYKIDYVKKLPVLVDDCKLDELEFDVRYEDGETILTPLTPKLYYGSIYLIKIYESNEDIPDVRYGELVRDNDGYDVFVPGDRIAVPDGSIIRILECTARRKVTAVFMAVNKIPVVLETENLESVLDDYKDFDSNDFVKVTWDEFDAAYKAASDILAKAKADPVETTQDAINDAISALNDAYDMLTQRADVTLLGKMLDECAGYYESDYTAKTWASYAESLAKAQAVYDGVENGEDISSIKVNEVQEELQNEINGLKEKLLLTGLVARIEEAESLTESDYTADSWARMMEMLEAARELRDNANEDETWQQEIDDVEAELMYLIDNLVEVSESGTPGGDDTANGSEEGNEGNKGSEENGSEPLSET